MKQLVVLMGCFIFLLGPGGCQDAGRQGRVSEKAIVDDGQFPEVMVGAWETEGGSTKWGRSSRWGIKFEPDGSIDEIIHSMAGPVKLSEGGVYMEGREPNTYAVFEMGPCEAKYYPETDELEVKIVLEHYEVKLLGSTLEGRIESYISGPVSKDGKTWEANLTNLGWLKTFDLPPVDILKAQPIPLVFTKVDPSQIKQEHKHEQGGSVE